MYQNQFIYSRERRRFGRQCLFTDRTQLLLSIQPSYKRRFAYILRNPVTRSTQLSDQKAFSEVETENVTYGEHGMYHYEGGWPREINMNDEEQTQRHRKKIERDDNWGPQVTTLIRSAMEVSEQNSAVNIYDDFFADLPAKLGQSIRTMFEARPANIYRDFNTQPRHISNIDWQPSIITQFLVVHTPSQKRPATEAEAAELLVKKNESYDADPENVFFGWDSKNPVKPLVNFDCSEEVQTAFFCPRDDNFVAGGCRNGGVAVWDSQNGGMPLQSCPLEACHREAVSAMCWVHSKLNTEFYAGSYDGSIKYWDTRDLNDSLLEILLDPMSTDDQLRERAHGVTVLEFEYTIPVRFIIGSDMGHVFVGNRKGTTPTEILLSNYKVLSGPIRTIERNPFFVKNFLICGDWCAKVWSEECKASPTTLLIKKKCQINCGTWSTTRCSLFATGDEWGELDFWDLLLSQREPIFRAKFKSPITSIKFRADGEYVAVAFHNGDVFLLEMDTAMKRSGSKEKALMSALFEREVLRSKLLDGRVEEIKLKAKTSLLEAEQKALAAAELEDKPELDPDDPDQFLQIIEADQEFKEALRVFNEIDQKIQKTRRERDYVMERTDFEHDSPYNYDINGSVY